MHRMIIALAMIFTVTSLAGCERYALDRQMEELCKKDGGIKLYEKIRLKKDMFDQSGLVKHEYKSVDGKYVVQIADGYLVTEEVSSIKDGDSLKGESSLSRIHTAVIRVDDKKILAEGIQYLRAGGDFFVIGHHSQSSCPDMPLDLAKEVFIQE